jgi:TolB protein
MKHLGVLIAVTATFSLACTMHEVDGEQTKGKTAALDAGPAIDWRQSELGVLADHVQLTFSDRFVKAGEAYFSPDDSKIIFQAVEVPLEDEKPAEFYAMFVADVERGASGGITGISNLKRISPPNSANTCGWFHPTDPNLVLFGSTLVEPKEEEVPAFQRKENDKYKWAFPPEMRIVQCDLRSADGTIESLKLLAGDDKAYQAEGSWSEDGRHILYCSRQSGDGDIYVLDTHTNKIACLVSAKGYDGGPFFSPDGKRICYRSDRRADEKLQLFVADLAFNDEGTIVGIEREYQLTDDGNVNWCPFWTHDGRHLVYSTSAFGHTNYEIFMCDADPGHLSGSTGTIKYGTAQKRITNATKADVLPAFSHDGEWMMWTSQRHDRQSSQLWAARFVFDDDKAGLAKLQGGKPEMPADTFHVQDPDTGMYYIYNRVTHELTAYDIRTHQTRPVTDPIEIEKAIFLFGESEPD